MRLSGLRNHKGIMIVLFIINLFIGYGRRFVRDIHLGNDLSVPASSINGTITVVVFMFGVLMVFIDYKIGLYLSIFILMLSSVGALRDIVISHDFATLPGVLSCLFFIGTLILISNQLRLNYNYNVTDHVTGLTNRYGFEEMLKDKHLIKGHIIVYIHLTGMGKINTNMGRSYFDECMRIIADRIKKVLKKNGMCFKLEGVDYALVLPKGSDYMTILSSIIESIEDKLELKKNNVTVNCYIKAVAGVVNLSSDDMVDNYSEVMRYADIAMNNAMRGYVKGTKICEFSNEIKHQIERENSLERIIKEALNDKRFYLNYQPQYMIESGKLRGFEALIRLKLEDGSMISPGEFISVAEKSDLIIDIDKYVLKMAMKQFVSVCTKAEEPIVLSVNVSAKDMSSPDFTDDVKSVLDATGFPAQCLEIEITEYSLAESLENTLANIDKLRSWGVKIALDDFGTGYTSLSQLLNLPVDLLKIDKSLIDNVVNSQQNCDFIKSVIYMGHLMGCEVISEGVEQEEQLKLLAELECDFVQGYVKNRPLDYNKAVELVK